MIFIYTAEFVLISILCVLNINHILSNLFRSNKFQFKISPVFVVFIINSIIFTPCLLLNVPPVFSLIITMSYYIFLFVYILISNKSIKRIKAIYVTILYLFVDSVFSSLVLILFDIFTQSKNERLIIWTASIIFNAIICVITCISSRKRRFKTVPNTEVISTSTYVMILLAIIFSGGLVENQKQRTSNIILQNDITKIFILITTILFIIIIISLLINCVSKVYFENASKILENQVSTQVEYYNTIDNLNEEIRELRHDYKNHMLCIQSLIEHEEYDDASQYISQITKQNIIEGMRFYTGNKIADSILNDKFEKAKMFNAEIVFEGEITNSISAFDICTILSNAIDNAIESCQKQKTAITKVIAVHCIYSKGIQMIKITNPINENLNLDNGLISTSKDDKISHGFGLYNIQKVVRNHRGDFDISVHDGLFVLWVGFKID